MNYAHLVSPSSFIKMVLGVQEDDYTWWYVRKFTLRDWCSNHITWVTVSWCWNQGMSHGNVLFDHIPSSMTFKTYAQISKQTNMTYCTYKAIRDWRKISRSNGGSIQLFNVMILLLMGAVVLMGNCFIKDPLFLFPTQMELDTQKRVLYLSGVLVGDSWEGTFEGAPRACWRHLVPLPCV